MTSPHAAARLSAGVSTAATGCTGPRDAGRVKDCAQARCRIDSWADILIDSLVRSGPTGRLEVDRARHGHPKRLVPPPRRPDHARVPGSHRRLPHARILGGGARDRFLPAPEPLCRRPRRSEISGGPDYDADDHHPRCRPLFLVGLAMSREAIDLHDQITSGAIDLRAPLRFLRRITPLASDYLGRFGVDVEG